MVKLISADCILRVSQGQIPDTVPVHQLTETDPYTHAANTVQAPAKEVPAVRLSINHEAGSLSIDREKALCDGRFSGAVARHD